MDEILMVTVKDGALSYRTYDNKRALARKLFSSLERVDLEDIAKFCHIVLNGGTERSAFTLLREITVDSSGVCSDAIDRLYGYTEEDSVPARETETPTKP